MKIQMAKQKKGTKLERKVRDLKFKAMGTNGVGTNRVHRDKKTNGTDYNVYKETYT